MLFLYINKHFITNFKNFLISQYIINFKNLFFNNQIYLKINYYNKTFFLACFLLYTFCIYKFFFNKKNKRINLFLKPVIFFSFFNNVYYPLIKEIKIFKKKTKNLISFRFKFNNIFSSPLSCFFNKKINWLKINNIFFELNFFFDKKYYRYLQFYLNFFQLPIFKKN